MSDDEEIGRELRASDLVPRTVYVLWKEMRPEPAVTFWYMGNLGSIAMFFAEVTQTRLLLLAAGRRHLRRRHGK